MTFSAFLMLLTISSPSPSEARWYFSKNVLDADTLVWLQIYDFASQPVSTWKGKNAGNDPNGRVSLISLILQRNLRLHAVPAIIHTIANEILGWNAIPGIDCADIHPLVTAGFSQICSNLKCNMDKRLNYVMVLKAINRQSVEIVVIVIVVIIISWTLTC